MEKMIKIFTKITKDNTVYNKIIYDSLGHTEQNYKRAVEEFSVQSIQNKEKVVQQILLKFKKQRQCKFIMSTLLLIDYLQSIDPQICLTNCYQPKLKKYNKKESKVNKICIAEEEFIKFYFSYIKQISAKCKKQIDFLKCSLEDYIQYNQVALKLIFQVLKIDFVIDYCLKNSPEANLVKMCCGSIFSRISFDLRIIHNFLDKWLHIATKKQKQAFMVNQIYQKTIYINKNISKLKKIAKQLKVEVRLNLYEVDKQLNLTIQKNMYARQSQRKEYVSSKKVIQLKSTMQQKGFEMVEGDSILRLNQFI